MNITIGIKHQPREITAEIEDMTPDELATMVERAATEGIFRIKDKKDRTIVVPGTSLAYAILDEEKPAKVGFGIG